MPPEQGPCEAMFRRFHFDPQSGGCRPFVYGGCDGNANNFSTASACLFACAKAATIEAMGSEWSQGEVAMGCKIGDVYYPSGGGAVPSPDRSNHCRCDAGKLSDCTRRAGIPCPNHTVFGTRCAERGSKGGCLIVESGCLTKE